MTHIELSDLGQKLTLQLPQFYKELLTNYPKELHSLGKPYNSASELYLVSSADAIEELNNQFKFLTIKIAVGQDGCGNYYFISKTNDDQTVYFLDHEEVVVDESTGKMNWELSIKPCYSNIQESTLR